MLIFRVGCLNEVLLRPGFRKSLDLQVSFLVGYFKCFLVYATCFHETVHDKWCLHKNVRQIENDIERGFVEHWLNSD